MIVNANLDRITHFHKFTSLQPTQIWSKVDYSTANRKNLQIHFCLTVNVIPLIILISNLSFGLYFSISICINYSFFYPDVAVTLQSSTYFIRHCLFVCLWTFHPSVTFVYCDKTTEVRIMPFCRKVEQCLIFVRLFCSCDVASIISL